MATMTLLEKARQRRLDALTSLGAEKNSGKGDGFGSLFDNVFDNTTLRAPRNNVIAFRSARKEIAADPVRIAA